MFDDLLHRLRAVFRRESMEASLDEELRAHLDYLTGKYVQAGLGPEEARRRARLEFGGLDQVKEECRDARGVRLLETLLQDLRYGLRQLRANRAFSIIIVLILALGIGANTAIFSLFDAVLLRSLPVRQPSQLVLFRWQAHHPPGAQEFSSFGDCRDQSGANPSGCSFPLPLLRTMQTQASTFTSVAGFAGTARLTATGNGTPTLAHGELVSGNYFSTLGVRAELGRTIIPADDVRGAAPVLVLSDAYWHKAFGGDASVIGRTLVLNNVPFTIVGVADRRFTRLSPGKSQDFWLCLEQMPRLGIPWGNHIHGNGNWWVVLLGRLRPGVSLEQAQASASLLFRNTLLHQGKPLFKSQDDPRIALVPAQQGLTGLRIEYGQPLHVILLAVGLILLIACANVAGLLLARSTARSREIAVRLALGASRGRLIRQLLTESLLLSLVGGALGVACGDWGMHLLVGLISAGSKNPFNFRVALDGHVLLYTLIISLLTGILFGLAPALQGTRINLAPALKDGVTSTPSAASKRRRSFSLRSALVVSQVALSVVVLTGAGLLVRTLNQLRSVNPGFNTRNVLLFGIDPTAERYDNPHIQALYRAVDERITALPGVRSVSYSSNALLTGSLWITDVRRADKPAVKPISVDLMTTGPGYFTTLGIPLLAGRGFRNQDFERADAAADRATVASPVKKAATRSKQVELALPVLVNQEFVRRAFGSGHPLGKILLRGRNDNSSGDTPLGRPPSPRYEIIGVVRNTKYSTLRRAVHPMMFLPLTGGGAHFEVRAAGSARALIPEVRRAVTEVDARLPLTDVHTQQEEIGFLLGQDRLVARLGSVFGLLALVLACVGLYGLLAGEIARRRREVGIRMALGADRCSILRMVLGQGMKLTLIGMAVGLGASLLLMRSLASLLYGVGPWDPATFVAVAITLIAVALLACAVPARRATRIDPMIALRYE